MLLRPVWQAQFLMTSVHQAHTIVDRTLNRLDQLHAGLSVTEAELKAAITKCWRRETSDDPRRWSHNNPAHGQCAVTALIVQDFFGGELLCASINLTPHYWNLLPNRRELDLTREQFKMVFISGAPIESTRQFILSFSETRRNYRRLHKLVRAALHARD
jgi:hypothetical protein